VPKLWVPAPQLFGATTPKDGGGSSQEGSPSSRETVERTPSGSAHSAAETRPLAKPVGRSTVLCSCISDRASGRPSVDKSSREQQAPACAPRRFSQSATRRRFALGCAR